MLLYVYKPLIASSLRTLCIVNSSNGAHNDIGKWKKKSNFWFQICGKHIMYRTFFYFILNNHKNTFEDLVHLKYVCL